jgi:hypothetical protein
VPFVVESTISTEWTDLTAASDLARMAEAGSDESVGPVGPDDRNTSGTATAATTMTTAAMTGGRRHAGVFWANAIGSPGA